MSARAEGLTCIWVEDAALDKLDTLQIFDQIDDLAVDQTTILRNDMTARRLEATDFRLFCLSDTRSERKRRAVIFNPSMAPDDIVRMLEDGGISR